MVISTSPPSSVAPQSAPFPDIVLWQEPQSCSLFLNGTLALGINLSTVSPHSHPYGQGKQQYASSGVFAVRKEEICIEKKNGNNVHYLKINILWELHLVLMVSNHLGTFIHSDMYILEGGKLLGTVCLPLSLRNIRF